MQRRDRIILRKIISEITVGKQLLGEASREDFIADELRKRAVAMTVINIGELVKTLSDETRKAHTEIDWRGVAGFRDVTAHGYETLRMDDVYNTVKDVFPEIASRIRSILEKESEAELLSE